MSEVLLDPAGRRRSPATMPGFHAGRKPRNKGLRYPADPPKVEEIIVVMRAAGDLALEHAGYATATGGRPRRIPAGPRALALARQAAVVDRALRNERSFNG